MLSKFFSHGKGAGSGPVDYVLGKDRDREGATLLHGDPEMMVKLIDSLHSQKHKYTSGALSFSQHISDDEIALAIKGYNQFLSADNAVELSTLWVKHEDKDRTELHFVVANTDLLSGRAYTPYVDRMDFKTRDALDDYLNTRIDDLDPDDPANKRLAASAADYINQSKDRKALVESINGFIESSARDKVQAGDTFTREDVKNALTGLGFKITREADKTISVSHPDMPKNLRLKGTFYESDTRISAEYFSENEQASQRYRADSESRASTALKEFQERLQGRHERVRQRFEHSQNLDNQLQQSPADVRHLTQSADSQHPLDFGNVPTPKPSRGRKKVEREPTAKRTDQDVREQSPTLAEYARRFLLGDTQGQNPEMWLHDGQRAESLQGRIDCYFKNDPSKYLGYLDDQGNKITAHDFKTDRSAAFNIVMQSKAKGWKSVEFSGSDGFVREAMTYAIQNGLKVTPKNATQAEILEQVQNDDRTRKDALRAIKDADSTIRKLEQSSSDIRIDSSKLDSLSRELERQQQQLNSESADFEQATKQLEREVNTRNHSRERDGLSM